MIIQIYLAPIADFRFGFLLGECAATDVGNSDWVVMADCLAVSGGALIDEKLD